jgi:DTW domain-containing protein YfiP
MSSPEPPAGAGRPCCPACRLPLRTCLCALVRPIAHRIAIRVLQHPEEASQAKGTVRLLQRCLQDCRIEVGEQWAAPPWPLANCWLLYPGGKALPPEAPAPRQILLLDGSWRHSRKLMHLNPWLQALPRYALRATPPPLYSELRKAHSPQQLSSLEAVAQALRELEANALASDGLRAAMQDWLALQRAQRS